MAPTEWQSCQMSVELNLIKGPLHILRGHKCPVGWTFGVTVVCRIAVFLILWRATLKPVESATDPLIPSPPIKHELSPFPIKPLNPLVLHCIRLSHGSTHAWKDRQTNVTFFLSDCSDCCPNSDGNPLKSSTWSLLIIMKFLHSGPTFVWYPSLKHTVFTGPITLWNKSVISQLTASYFLPVCSSGFSSVLQTRYCAPTLHNASGALVASLPGSNHNH